MSAIREKDFTVQSIEASSTLHDRVRTSTSVQGHSAPTQRSTTRLWREYRGNGKVERMNRTGGIEVLRALYKGLLVQFNHKDWQRPIEVQAHGLWLDGALRDRMTSMIGIQGKWSLWPEAIEFAAMTFNVASQDSLSPTKRLFLKISWLPSHLVGHELNVIRALKDLSTTPISVGLAQVPLDAKNLGFRTETSSSGGQQLQLSILVYWQDLGNEISEEMPEDALLDVHLQLIRLLLAYPEHEGHCRDLNTGNVLCRKADDGNSLSKPTTTIWTGCL